MTSFKISTQSTNIFFNKKKRWFTIFSTSISNKTNKMWFKHVIYVVLYLFYNFNDLLKTHFSKIIIINSRNIAIVSNLIIFFMTTYHSSSLSINSRCIQTFLKIFINWRSIISSTTFSIWTSTIRKFSNDVIFLTWLNNNRK